MNISGKEFRDAQGLPEKKCQNLPTENGQQPKNMRAEKKVRKEIFNEKNCPTPWWLANLFCWFLIFGLLLAKVELFQYFDTLLKKKRTVKIRVGNKIVNAPFFLFGKIQNTQEKET